ARGLWRNGENSPGGRISARRKSYNDGADRHPHRVRAAGAVGHRQARRGAGHRTPGSGPGIKSRAVGHVRDVSTERLLVRDFDRRHAVGPDRVMAEVRPRAFRGVRLASQKSGPGPTFFVFWDITACGFALAASAKPQAGYDGDEDRG